MQWTLPEFTPLISTRPGEAAIMRPQFLRAGMSAPVSPRLSRLIDPEGHTSRYVMAAEDRGHAMTS
jgi:hypothetical protein